MNKETIKIMNAFDGFTDGVRVLLLLHRSKDGGKEKDRKLIRKISNNMEEFEMLLDELIDIKRKNKLPYRIYSCINKRDINKAIRTFKQNQLDADYYNNKDKTDFYLDIKNRWLSALMKPSSRAELNFLIDIDDKNEEKKAERIVANIVGRNFKKYETKNGFHFITPPFNPALMKQYEIKKDGVLLLSY